MRNYYEVLGIDRSSEEIEKLNSIDALKPTLDPGYFDDVESVLSDDTFNMHYRRLHLQYEAIAAVLARDVPQQDTNSWSKRVVEFVPTPNDLPE